MKVTDEEVSKGMKLLFIYLYKSKEAIKFYCGHLSETLFYISQADSFCIKPFYGHFISKGLPYII